jgi:hypothetical protein
MIFISEGKSHGRFGGSMSKRRRFCATGMQHRQIMRSPGLGRMGAAK